MKDIFDEMTTECKREFTGREIALEYCNNKILKTSRKIDWDFFDNIIRFLKDEEYPNGACGCIMEMGFTYEEKKEVHGCAKFVKCEQCWEYVRDMVIER